MIDTVWIRLTSVETLDNKTIEGEEHFMFGPTGIVRFKTTEKKTILFNSAKVAVAEVTEDSEFIMDILRKMRGTEGKLNGKKQKEKSRSKSKTSSRKASRKT